MLYISKPRTKTASTLIFTWGNPSRGDDAIGPIIYDRLKQEILTDVDLLTDYQLQIEHIIDLENRQKIIFIDASLSAKPPFEYYQISPTQDDSYTSHAMSPQSLLAVYQKVNQRMPPDAFMLSVRGYKFGLGLDISKHAMENINIATDFIRENNYVIKDYPA